MSETFVQYSNNKKKGLKLIFASEKKTKTQIGKRLCTEFLSFLNSINIHWSAVILDRQVLYDAIPIDK